MIDKDLLYTAESVNEGFPGGARANNLPANAGDTGLIPDLGRSQSWMTTMVWSLT